MLKKFLMIAGLCLSGSIVVAQTAPPTKPAAPSRKPDLSTTHADAALPTNDDVEAAMKRTLAYDPSLKWVIHDIRSSAIPGVADILFSINSQAPQHLFYSIKT